MTYRDFVFWLQGFFELANPKEISPDQLLMIKNHLALARKCSLPTTKPKQGEMYRC